jgi:type II secretory pathway component GspD/PulD (secretin)
VLAGGLILADDQTEPASKEFDPASEPGTVLRPNVPDEPPHTEELQLRPEANGKLRFNFQGQPWQGVVEWLARVSHLSLDWQELPAGFLNLRTEREYTIDEARDLINRHLLDRNFTLLKNGEILSVVAIKKLDPSLVPWLTPDELDDSQPHDFVRVIFPLDSLMAETAAEEFKSLLSPNGKLTALKSTNRLESMDAVVNLREIQKLLSEEQSPHGQERLVREFKLKHVRAADVQQQLQKLLGLDKSSVASSSQSSDPVALVQQMAQIIQRGSGAAGPSPPAKSPAPPPVYLVADPRNNSILAHAPAEQMAVITQAMRVIDTPSDKSRSLLRNNHRMQVYTLAVAEPETVVKLLQDVGDLDPGTRLQVDKKRRAIVAHAPLTDHVTIRLLVDKIDGKNRNFRVIRLNRVEADYVASAIDLVMGGGDGSKRQPARDNSSEDEMRRFRVVADVEHNRLLLWVNETELEEVQSLLAELGESAAPDQDPQTAARVLDLPWPAEAQKLLRRLQELWPTVAPNPLEFGPRTKEADSPAPERNKVPHGTRPPNTLRSPVNARAVEFQPVSQREPRSSAPVHIDRDADGRLHISSQDDAAADLARKLIAEIAPAASDLKVFRMQHKKTSAYAVAENLKQVFEQKQKADRPVARFFDPGSGKWISNSREGDARKQQKAMPPRFIVDLDTNSILAVGADADQLETIEQIIALYDTAESSKDPLPTRITQLIKIKNAQARQIADAIKDVYKDLLTANEPPPRGDQKDRPWPEPRYSFVFNSAARGGDLPEVQVRFKGQLSIGVDEASNTLIVSAPAAILEDVTETIESLDEAARSQTTHIKVVRVDRTVNAAEFQKRLQRIATRPQSSQQRNQSQASQQP